MFKRMLILILSIFFQNSFASYITLNAIQKNIIVNGKKSMVFDIVQNDGTEGYIGKKGDYFDVLLQNQTNVPISIHWHGLILPNNQDGIPYVTQLPIPPQGSHHYYFKIMQSGTFWMHSHFKFHEQQLLTAPLILTSENDPYKKDQDIVIMLQSFTFKNPEKIFDDLKNAQKSMAAMKANMPDLNDVAYDAYLANRKTLRNPDIFLVKPDKKIRLRIINGSSASNFWISTGVLNGKIIAVDGNDVTPLLGTHFQVAVAQRIDIEVTIPKSGGVFPIIAQVEGLKARTGVILATEGVVIPTFSDVAPNKATALNDEQEYQLHAAYPLVFKPSTIKLVYELTGDMNQYIWKINNEIWPLIKPYKIKKGDHVEMIFINNTNMAHPMHLHGHVFQVTEINGHSLKNGPLRDTILVLPHTTKKIVFDANNPGIWMLHCHVLYHMLAGMMTTTNYIDYPEPEYYKRLLRGEIKEM